MRTDRLDTGVYERLCDFTNRKSDIEPLVNARWAWMVFTGMNKKGYTKEDALISVLELLESNNIPYDLSLDDYDALAR